MCGNQKILCPQRWSYRILWVTWFVMLYWDLRSSLMITCALLTQSDLWGIGADLLALVISVLSFLTFLLSPKERNVLLREGNTSTSVC